MDPQDQNNSMYNASKKKSSKHEKNFHGDINHDIITSFKAIMEREVGFEDDNNEQYFNNLSIGDLNTKVKKYNTLYLENKINNVNAFDIDLINCVQQMVKRSKNTDIMEFGNTFDAISKVYSCRVDDIVISGNKLIKEFVSETKDKKFVKENENKTKQKYRKKLMLTTPDKLCRKDNQMLSKKNYLSVGHDSDIVDYANFSRILINKYTNKTYWPEYNVSKNVEVNENQQKTFEMENISFLVENGKICPPYHKFIAECDKSTNCNDEIDMNKLDNICTHFNQETSAFCVNSDETDDSMDMVFSETSSERIVPTDPGSSNQNNQQFSRQDNLDSLSQTLSILDTTDSSDYTFFDRHKMRNLKCSNHWKEKFKMMTIDRSKKAMLNKSCVAQTHSKTNVPEYKCSNSKAITFKVDFYSDISTTLKNIKLNSNKNQCSYINWQPSNNLIPSSDQLYTRPIRQLESCEYINMVPNWYKHEFEEFNLNTNSNAFFLFPEQDIVDQVPVDNADSIVKNVMDTDHSEGENEDDEMKIEINNDNNLTIALNQKNIPDDTYEEYSTSSSGCMDMHQLKKYILNIIEPAVEKGMKISYTDVLLRCAQLLPENMKENISASVIYVAILHLCNELGFGLDEKNDETFIYKDLK